MGVQSFQFPVDFLNNIERPIIYIARKDKNIVGSVSIYDDLSLTFNLNAFQTASLKIYKDIDGKEQHYFKYFEEGMLIMIPGLSWYVIHVDTNIEPTGISKSITANSLEYTLCYKRLIDFECNAGEILYDDYVKTVFYDPTNQKGSLLHRVLNVTPNWSIGHVDQSLCNKQRSFDQPDIDVYSFLTGEVSEAFNCLFTFDTFNCTVNAYDLDNYGSDTDIFVSMDNLAQNMTETIEENSIFTCYRINGGDGVYINEVNPNGTNKIYNFEYYLPEMPQKIQSKIKTYNELYQKLKPQYDNIMLRMQSEIDIIQELYTRLPDSLSSKDWTKYGLTFLQSKKNTFETMDQLYVAQGMNNLSSISYNLYKQNLEDLNAVSAELNVRQSEIDAETEKYNTIKAERDTLQEQLDMDTFFSVDEWKTIDAYVIEETYTNDNYIVTDLEGDSERFDIEKQLYDIAWKDLSKKCRPKYQYSSTLTNILTIPEFKEFIHWFELGNFIRMETDYDTIVKLRIISFTVDYTNTQNISVTFSDAIRVMDVYEDASSIQSQANSAAMSFKFNKDQYDSTVKQGNFVAEMRKYGLDVATTAIHNSRNQSQTWDETGMTFRQWNDQRQDYDPEMIKIINNQIVFSDDGMNTVRMAIGKIALGNGEYGYGINAEVLMSKLVMSENLWIENNAVTYKIDDAGFYASNGTNTVKIQPNKSDELFSIYKGNNKKFHIDASGNIHFEGDLTGATGTFSGLVSGGSINIGNGNFTVDSNGFVEMSGDITADTSLYLTFQLFNKIKVNALNVSLGKYEEYFANGERPSGILGISSAGTIFEPIINLGDGASVIKTSKQFQPSSIYSETGLFEELVCKHINIADLWLMASTEGTYGGTVYKCNGSYGSEGIASSGWVKNYVNRVMPSSSNFANVNHTHNNYVSSASPNTHVGKPSTVVNNMYTSGNTLIFGKYSSWSSDKRLKTDVVDLPDLSSVYMSFKPKKFKFNRDLSGYDNDWHYGLLAQEVEESLNNNGITLKDTSLVYKVECDEDFNEKNVVNDDYVYKLDKNELHVMHIQMIQKIWNKVEKQEKEINELKERIIGSGKTK